jgi:hypothetical protein
VRSPPREYAWDCERYNAGEFEAVAVRTEEAFGGLHRVLRAALIRLGGRSPERAKEDRADKRVRGRQDKALRFYTGVLGYLKKSGIPMGPSWWLTVVSPDDTSGVELLLSIGRPFGCMAGGPYAFQFLFLWMKLIGRNLGASMGPGVVAVEVMSSLIAHPFA